MKNKPYELQYRFIVYRDGKVIRRTQWELWARYKSLGAIINAWEYIKKDNYKFKFWLNNNKDEYRMQYRPFTHLK